MANGTTRRELAQADRVRERAAQRQRGFRNVIADVGRAQMQSDDGESEITGNWKQVNAKIPLPRSARIAIGFGLAALLFAAAIVAVLKAWPR